MAGRCVVKAKAYLGLVETSGKNATVMVFKEAFMGEEMFDVKLRDILKDSNKVIDRIVKKIKGGMKQFIIHVNLLTYVRNLLEEDDQRPM
ncbi:hypothetical protein Godav_012755, partial [Gossypium davidsonii]|nr:hypothetical protein [Gossypium davidsonii]